MKVIADDALICVVSCLLMVYMMAVGLWRNYDWGQCWPGRRLPHRQPGRTEAFSI